MFYDHQFCHRKLSESSGFITHLYCYLYTDCIFILRHPDDGHWSDQNSLVNNNNID
jgi:hypothetical protein